MLYLRVGDTIGSTVGCWGGRQWGAGGRQWGVGGVDNGVGGVDSGVGGAGGVQTFTGCHVVGNDVRPQLVVSRETLLTACAVCV